MLNKELIDLQKGCNSTCAIIQNKDIEELNSKIIINSNCKNNELLRIFIENISKLEEKVDYLVIEEIDKLEIEEQDKFYQIIKDREFQGHKLPKDIIIVLTVEDKEKLKNISQELYHLSVVAF